MDNEYPASDMYKILRRAQETYGYQKQMSVTIEELCELSAILSKYSRYPSHEVFCAKLRQKVLEEFVDVEICLYHIFMMFNFNHREIKTIRDKKIERLENWLNKSSDIHQTNIDR
jgi:predicted house-cleaning noncanonical NTP pyrophosphatase (MazG superfamily)